MTSRSEKVDQLMAGLDHPRKDAVEYLRSAILRADPGISEQVKWNAPSFVYDGEDRVTFQLKSADVQLIMHRGAKVRDGVGDGAPFAFDDGTGLMQWRSNDRAVVTFTDLADVKAREKEFIPLVKRWIKAK